jgi:hypothetical protein
LNHSAVRNGDVAIHTVQVALLGYGRSLAECTSTLPMMLLRLAASGLATATGAQRVRRY